VIAIARDVDGDQPLVLGPPSRPSRRPARSAAPGARFWISTSAFAIHAMQQRQIVLGLEVEA